MGLVTIMAVLIAVALPALGQEGNRHPMVTAIVDHCLPKVSGAVPLPTEGLTETPQGFRTPDGTVAVLDSAADFACQVIATADPEPMSRDLSAWAASAGFAYVGRVPFTRRNQRGLYLYGRAEAGGFVQIHVTNLPDGRLGALLTRADQNPEAERALP